MCVTKNQYIKKKEQIIYIKYYGRAVLCLSQTLLDSGRNDDKLKVSFTNIQ